ncbi:hypothetical protein CYMTET_19227 [Cymbomonas tetramitiformis]|uniref:Uncharacterized protein n=1 Tax=Cymbomonas tetramitiformis TaxID=36881 RepID=A0AAE0L5E1_9CHLO|nr:hypothetical protein CYMTET_19227 [Cymbomonas tetramitiformis]
MPPTRATCQYSGGAAGTAAAVGVPGGDVSATHDIFARLLARLDKIEAYIKTQRLGDAPAAPPKRHLKGLDGFRVGAHTDPRVGFDPGAKKTIPKCPRCPTAGDGAPQWCGRVRRLVASTSQLTASPQRFPVLPGTTTLMSRRNFVTFVNKLVRHSPWGKCPREEFPGGIDLVPVRHPVPTVSIGPTVSAVACSFPQPKASFVELEEESRAPDIDDLFADTDGEEIHPPIYEEPRAVTHLAVFHAAVRPQQVVGCGVPPFGMRPPFIMLVCRVGLLCFGIAGAAAGLGDIGTDSDGISVTEDPVLQLFAAADGGMAAAAPYGDMASEHGGVPTWDVP